MKFGQLSFESLERSPYLTRCIVSDVSTRNPIALTPSQKLYWIRLLFIHKNDNIRVFYKGIKPYYVMNSKDCRTTNFVTPEWRCTQVFSHRVPGRIPCEQRLHFLGMSWPATPVDTAKMLPLLAGYREDNPFKKNDVQWILIRDRVTCSFFRLR